MSREEWLKKRQRFIGASEAACLLGLSKWQNNQELFLRKTSEISGLSDFTPNEFIKKGNDLEPHIRAIFRIENKHFKVIYRNFDVRINSNYPFIGATLDGDLEDEEGNKGILEIKTVEIFTRQQKEEWNERVPDQYYCQVLFQMLATGYSFAILFAYIKDGDNIFFRSYRFNRKDHQESIDLLEKEAIAFWGYVERNEMPPLKLPSI